MLPMSGITLNATPFEIAGPTVGLIPGFDTVMVTEMMEVMLAAAI